MSGGCVNSLRNRAGSSYCFELHREGSHIQSMELYALLMVQILDLGKPMSWISMNYQPQLVRFQPSPRNYPPVKSCNNILVSWDRVLSLVERGFFMEVIPLASSMFPLKVGFPLFGRGSLQNPYNSQKGATLPHQTTKFHSMKPTKL